MDPESGIASIVSDAPALFPAGTTVVTWTATNGAGLTAQATQNVNVTLVDVTPPTITAPADVSVTVAAAPVAVTIGTATAVDPESGIASIVSDAPALFPAGTTVVTWTATNGQGLTVQATQNVTVTVVAPTGNVITGFALYNGLTDAFIKTLVNGDTVSLSADCSGGVTGCNIEAVVPSPEGDTQSVRLNLDGGPIPGGPFRNENGAPYFLGGDTAGDVFDLPIGQPYIGAGLTLGSHTVHATPFSDNSGGGVQGPQASVTFTVIP